MKKEIIIFILAYIVASLIRGFIMFYTGFSFSIFQDKFNLFFLAIDFSIWVLAYVGVRLIITRFTKAQ